jgi:neutral ceramidase
VLFRSIGRAPARIGHNRRQRRQDGQMVLGHNPGGPEAPWVDVLRADRADGGPMGLLYAHAAHPVNLRGLEVSAEYPGYAARFIAKNLDGAVPMFAQACCGDINCAPMDGRFETSERQGALLGSGAVTAALQAEPVGGAGLAAACRTIALPLMIPTVEEAERALGVERERLEQARKDGKFTAYQVGNWHEGQVGWAEDYLRAAREGNRGQTQAFEIQAMRIGDLAVVSYPGEMFVTYQLWLDEASPFARTFTLGYTNGCIGYVPTASAYPEGGYEVNGAFHYYGTLMIGPECEGMIRETTVDLLNGLKG